MIFAEGCSNAVENLETDKFYVRYGSTHTHIGNHISYTITHWHDGQNNGGQKPDQGPSPIETPLVIIDNW